MTHGIAAYRGNMDFSVKIYRALIWLTLYAAALHFFDNVYFFDQYPEPAWLRAPIVGLLWVPLALLAHRAVDKIYTGKVDRSYSLVHGFVFANWISLGHYLFANPSAISPRINLMIGLQVGMATVLLGYTLWLQFSRSRESFRWSMRAWGKNVALFAVAVIVLETIWPSRYSDWWMVWR
jgi:hypothetical protein